MSDPSQHSNAAEFSLPLPSNWAWLSRLFGGVLGLNAFAGIVGELSHRRGHEFLSALLRRLDIQPLIEGGTLNSIPKSGRLIVTCNHPCGGVEALIALELLLRSRPDAKLVVNRFLVQIPNLSECLIAVDPPRQTRQRTAAGVRAIVRHLEAENCILIFPAGWVASRVRNGIPWDNDWNPVLGRIILLSRAPVLPLFVDARNSAFFYFVRAVNRGAGSLLFLREFLNKKGQRIPVFGGSVVPFDTIQSVDDPERIMQMLRSATFRLPQD